ncbi:hypothetical protein LSTR_LSTR013247 [Laodelphax striatellus]|uniref:Uncharacterized protein n=1 Tax=Laodelphax striatellus TaxID=195883 RepID=A0A482WM31_LAOST|nr:hypothetical protein LSTR_LSTR013247 [Laodelphax striatellus]
MLPSLHSSISVSIIVVTSVLFILCFVEHVDGTVNYLIPATQTGGFVVKPIEQADGSLAYEISNAAKPGRQTSKEKATANHNRPNTRSGAANDQKQTSNALKAPPPSPLPATAPAPPDNNESPLQPPLSLDEPYADTDTEFVWPVKLASKYSNRPVTTPSALPLRLPSTLPVTGSPPSTVTSPVTPTSQTNPSATANSETLPTLPDLSADSSQSPAIISPADTPPALPDPSVDSSQSPAIISPADTLPALPDLSADSSQTQTPDTTGSIDQATAALPPRLPSSTS